jgi:hypothetical protein
MLFVQRKDSTLILLETVALCLEQVNNNVPIVPDLRILILYEITDFIMLKLFFIIKEIGRNSVC